MFQAINQFQLCVMSYHNNIVEQLTASSLSLSVNIMTKYHVQNVI